jgi:hypothetical protein
VIEKTIKIVADDMGITVSDGYHTFDELYDHRCFLYATLCLLHADKCFWKPDFEGWFCLYWESPNGQISYHLPNYMLPMIQGKIQQDDDHVWDKHTSGEVLLRLQKYAEELSR